jgi:hypothetical protein
MSEARMEAVICVDETTVVVREAPLNEIAAPLTNPVPLTVRVKAAPPDAADVGDRDVTVGTGLELATVKPRLLLVPPPGLGFWMATGKLPGAGTSLAGIAAVTWVEETKVVVRATPLKNSVEFDTKLVPVAISVNEALPATTDEGKSAVSVGTGFGSITLSFTMLLPTPSV